MNLATPVSIFSMLLITNKSALTRYNEESQGLKTKTYLAVLHEVDVNYMTAYYIHNESGNSNIHFLHALNHQ